MALVKCLECKNDVSSEAEFCPKCGVKIDLEKIISKQETDKKNSNKGCLIFLGILSFIFFVVIISNNDNSSTTIQNTNLPLTDSISLQIQKKFNDSIAKVNEEADKKFLKTKAGKIFKKHPEWTKEECTLLSEGKIWIGMHYDMLLYLRGKPDHVNTSNYGEGNEYQCCWDNYQTSCFYMKQDNIIHSYN